MAKRINISSGAPWEEIVGYSRAVRVGNTIEVTGTVAVDEQGKAAAVGDASGQTQFILKKNETVLAEAGAKMENVVRTRMYVTDISKWEEIGKAHGEVFRDIRPCTTMVEVSALISPDFLVEIEATAILD